MSLINDMLKDLEARKVAENTHLHHGDFSPSHALPHGQVEGMHHADVTPPVEPILQRHLAWLFWPFMVALLLLALGLYWYANPEPSASSVSDNQRSSPAAPVSILPLPETPPVAGPQEPQRKEGVEAGGAHLILLSAIEHDHELTLSFLFDHPLQEQVLIQRVGERIELRFPKVAAPPLQAPHPALQDWQSQVLADDWLVAFRWPSQGMPRFVPIQDKNAPSRWELSLPLPKIESLTTNSPVVASNARPPASTTPSSPPITRSLPSSSRAAVNMPALNPQQQVEALYAEAWQLHQKGRLELAMEKLRQALQRVPEFSRAREFLVQLLLKSGQSHAAETELVRGLELQPRQPELVETLARLWAEQGRHAQAYTFLRERMQADRIGHQALLAVLAARMGDHAVAAEAYRRAAEMDRDEPRWWLGQAVALENSGQPSAARAAYLQALRLPGLDAPSQDFIRDRLNHLSQGE